MRCATVWGPPQYQLTVTEEEAELLCLILSEAIKPSMTKDRTVRIKSMHRGLRDEIDRAEGE